MSSRLKPSIASSWFHVYAAAALPLGVVSYTWPLILPERLPVQDSHVRLRIAAAVVTAFATCAALAAIEDPLGRRRGVMVLRTDI